MRVIGLTGGIGSGKSTVSHFLAQLGAIIVDADQVTHQIYDLDSSLTKTLAEKFGNEILDSQLQKVDRKKLAEIVFSDSQKRRELESLIHPLIRKEIQKQIDSAKKQNPPCIIVDAALLIETGYYKQFEKVIVVKAELTQQLERLRKRNSFSQEEIESRIAAQMPLSEKLKVADWVIDNSGSLEETKKQVLEVFVQLKGK